jgi:PAS domain S-box-containing protein
MSSIQNRPLWNAANLNSPFRIAILACLVAIMSYLAAKLGTTVVIRNTLEWPLWPGNILLVSTLLYLPRRIWPIAIGAALVTFAFYDLRLGISIRSIILYQLSDIAEVLTAALGLSYCFGGVPQLDSVKALAKYSFFAVLLAPLAGAFLSALTTHGDYWRGWRIIFLSQALGYLTLTPAILRWVSKRSEWAQASLSRYLEAAGLLAGLAVLGYFSFVSPSTIIVPVLTIVPFFLWSALRFGTTGVSSVAIAVAFLAIWGAVQGRGPFIGQESANNVPSIQVFLLFVAAPFMVLAVVVEEHTQSQVALRQSEAYLAEAQGLSHTGSFGWKPDSGEIVWSDETYRIFEYDSAVKPTIDSVVQRVHPYDRTLVQQVIDRACQTGTDFEHEYRLLLADGRVKHVHAIAHALRDASGNREFIGAVTDITERKTAEEKIRRLVDANILGIFIWNLEGVIVEANEAFLRMVQYDREDLVSGRVRWTDLTPAEWRERDERAMTEVKGTGTIQPYEKEYFRKDGSRVPVLLGAALFQEGGNEGVAFLLDLSEQKRAEEALRNSEAYLAEAQRLSQTGSWAWSPDEDIKYWSEECYRVLSFDPEDGLPPFEEFFQRLHPDDQPGFRELIQTAIREKAEWEADYRILRPGGPVRDIHVVGHPVVSTSGHLVEFVGTVIDVTERKRAEQERARLRQLEADLVHTSRVSTLGEMAASIAHEIKQPIAAAITSANSCIEWLAHEPPNLDRARAAAARIDRYANRAAEIIDRVRSLYKKSPPQRELVDANGIIQEMLTLLKDEAAQSSIALRTELGAELPKIKADRVQLQQVFMNLMLNGIEAMEDSGGELTVKSQLQDGQLQFSVSDTGVGLPTEKMDQIFSAFFTTKPQGSGMGLAISRSIVESHGGRLWATANDGRGATFYFTLPTEMTETLSQVNVVTHECGR